MIRNECEGWKDVREQLAEEEEVLLSFEWGKNYDRQLFFSLSLWKSVALTKVHITNVICVIAGDSGGKFSSIFFLL